MHTPTRTPVNPLRAFVALLRRELQQHRGALVYAPLVIGGIMLILALLGMISGESFHVQIGSDVSTQGLAKLIGDASLAPQRAIAFQAMFLTVLFFFHAVLFVVVALYCLGALFDERRDRSVLFWKSMPVSDTRTVLSKLTTAMVSAPLIMLAVFAVTYLLLLCVASITIWRFGGSPLDIVWSSSSVLSLLGRAVVLEAINALWLLPVWGWLLFCSSFSRVRPFLWAAMVPFWIWVIGRWITWSGFTTLRVHELADWLAGRLAAGLTPIGAGGDFGDFGKQVRIQMPDARALEALGQADLWIGVIVGAAFVAAAIYWRRYRDDSI